MKKIDEPIMIAIDGPAGGGKSTVARNLARMLGFTYLDTGAMYRALTLKCMEVGIDLTDEDQVGQVMESSSFQMESLPQGARVYLDGKDVSEAIRHPEVSENVKHIAKMARARAALCDWQRRIAEGKQMIAEGRDMGTVVFPSAPVKIYLFASIEERARRRAIDLEELGRPTPVEDIIRDIKERDYEDTHRSLAPLKVAEDAISIDTTGMNLDEVTGKIQKIIEEKISRRMAEK